MYEVVLRRSFFSFLEFISLLFLHRGLSPHKKKKEMAQAFDPLGGGGGPKKKKTTVKESAQISEITEDDDESNDPFSPANIGGGSGGFTWKHDTRMCIYAPYIDENKTVKQGRKLKKELCCDRPYPFEIKEAIEKGMNLPCDLEDKCYSRDFWERGRVRVEYKNEDGTPKNPEFPTRRSILIECARLVPMHWGENGRVVREVNEKSRGYFRRVPCRFSQARWCTRNGKIGERWSARRRRRESGQVEE